MKKLITCIATLTLLSLTSCMHKGHHAGGGCDCRKAEKSSCSDCKESGKSDCKDGSCGLEKKKE